MLTVKYVLASGQETIREYEEVILDREDGDLVVRAFPPNQPDIATTFGPIKGCSAGDAQPTVYVMNRFGSTVATYRL